MRTDTRSARWAALAAAALCLALAAPASAQAPASSLQPDGTLVDIPLVDWLTPSPGPAQTHGLFQRMPADARAGLVITDDALGAAGPLRLTTTAPYQAEPTPPRSWWSRNWFWVTPLAIVGVVVGGWAVWCTAKQCWAD